MCPQPNYQKGVQKIYVGKIIKSINLLLEKKSQIMGNEKFKNLIKENKININSVENLKSQNETIT